MELTLRDLSKAFGAPEETILRWVRSGGLPARRIGHRYRFNRTEVEEWASMGGRRLSPRFSVSLAPPDPGAPLARALSLGGVHRDVAGATREEVLASVARLPGIPETIDRDVLLRLLLEREALASTGVGGGIALPHPREPLVVEIDEPRVLLGSLARPIDFRAPDGAPVSTLFLILSPGVRSHLDLLSRLAFALQDPAFRRLLDDRAPEEALLLHLRSIESLAAPRP